MTDRDFHNVLKRYLNGKNTPEEGRVVEDFYNRNMEKDLFDDYTEEEEQATRDRLKAEIFSKTTIDSSTKPSRGWFRVAASIALLVGIAMGYFLYSPAEPEIALIVKSTERGQKATITLGDGSVVKLNAESSITYPEQFIDIREVELVGEAFFEVAKNKNKRFVVRSGALSTTVLGTSFNVEARPGDEEMRVTVVTGKVAVATIDNQVDLSPGDQATYNRYNDNLISERVNIKDYLAWHEGIIYFSDADYAQVFDQLSLWYGVRFELINEPTEKWEVSGEFKDMSLELVMNTIGHIKGFDFDIQKDVVTIQFPTKTD